jgi:hypothetical protein
VRRHADLKVCPRFLRSLSMTAARQGLRMVILLTSSNTMSSGILIMTAMFTEKKALLIQNNSSWHTSMVRCFPGTDQAQGNSTPRNKLGPDKKHSHRMIRIYSKNTSLSRDRNQ